MLSRPSSRFLSAWLLLTLLSTITLLSACGGGGGGTTNPPPGTPAGTVTGQVLLGSGLPILTQGDGTRASTRIIDPQDIIASLPAPVNVGSDGRFTITKVPARTTPLYLQLRFTANRNLKTGGGGTTPVALNIPVVVTDGGTVQVNANLNEATLTTALRMGVAYSGPDGPRETLAMVRFDDNTVSADLNGDGQFSDDVAPDNNNDGLGDDRNKYDDNPGAYNEIEREGAITAITNDRVTIGGIIFRITASTSILGEDNQTLKLSDFNVGDLAEAEGYALPGSNDVLAKKLKAEDRLDDDDPVNPTPGGREVEREGILLAKTANSVTVRDITFTVTAATAIFNKETDAPMTLADLPVGGCLDAKGNRTADGIVATRLRYDPTCDDGGAGIEVEVEGRITAITSDTITVRDKTFQVIPPLEIVNKETDQPIPFSSLKVGDFVNVKGVPSGDTLRATRIRFDPDEDDDDGGGGGGTGGIEIEREGTVQARTSTSITVLNTTFTVNASTVVVDKDTDQPVAFSSIQVGEKVDVRGIQNGTSLVANRIRVDRDSDD